MIDVVMPQMGESIVEGTLTKWLKKAGEHVERDEPLFEISTDKVDTEIPSPAAGVLKDVLVEEGIHPPPIPIRLVFLSVTLPQLHCLTLKFLLVRRCNLN